MQFFLNLMFNTLKIEIEFYFEIKIHIQKTVLSNHSYFG